VTYHSNNRIGKAQHLPFFTEHRVVENSFTDRGAYDLVTGKKAIQNGAEHEPKRKRLGARSLL
jgi:hypothetical protein